MDVDETPQIWLHYLQGGHRELQRFLKYIQTKQTVKICCSGLVWCFSSEIRIKQKLHKFESMLWKDLPKNSLLKRFRKFTIVSNFTVIELFPAIRSWPNISLFKPFSDDIAFLRYGLLIFMKLNLMLLISVIIRNRGN